MNSTYLKLQRLDLFSGGSTDLTMGQFSPPVFFFSELRLFFYFSHRFSLTSIFLDSFFQWIVLRLPFFFQHIIPSPFPLFVSNRAYKQPSQLTMIRLADPLFLAHEPRAIRFFTGFKTCFVYPRRLTPAHDAVGQNDVLLFATSL